MKKREAHAPWLEAFPSDIYPSVLANQESAFEFIAESNGSATLQLPTGSGKTAIGFTHLRKLEREGKGPLFYIVPNKTLVDQVHELHPEAKKMYGRNEYPCIYYQDREVTAEESPCSFLDCPHRVCQETGETREAGVNPCPYYQDKYIAKQGGIVVCTFSFYLFSVFFNREWGEPAGLVIDEAHQIAKVMRQSLSHTISEKHLDSSVDFLNRLGFTKEANIVNRFAMAMRKSIENSIDKNAVLVETDDIKAMLKILDGIKVNDFQEDIRAAIRNSGVANEDKNLAIIKQLEVLTRDLVRYYRALRFAIPLMQGKKTIRNPLNYIYGHLEQVRGKSKRVEDVRLYIKSYLVAPLIRKMLASSTVAYSATIGKDASIFTIETGIDLPFFSLGSDFPSKNTRIFLPKDAANLARNGRNRREPAMTIRKIARTAKRFAEKGIRSLVVVVSNQELDKFLMMAREEGLNAISYYKTDLRPREAAQLFKDGEGDVLAGTVANYGEGLDLPSGIAPVIFFLRPAYPSPNDPTTVFEERRFGGERWKMWNWRVMLEALQVRGRNVRSSTDVGVVFFMSAQFRRFVRPSLPEWLEKAYSDDKNFDQCVEEALALLN